MSIYLAKLSCYYFLRKKESLSPSLSRISFALQRQRGEKFTTLIKKAAAAAAVLEIKATISKTLFQAE